MSTSLPAGRPEIIQGAVSLMEFLLTTMDTKDITKDTAPPLSSFSARGKYYKSAIYTLCTSCVLCVLRG